MTHGKATCGEKVPPRIQVRQPRAMGCDGVLRPEVCAGVYKVDAAPGAAHNDQTPGSLATQQVHILLQMPLLKIHNRVMNFALPFCYEKRIRSAVSHM